MIVDQENLNPGAWFAYETDKDGNPISRVKIRAHSTEFIEQVKNECVKEHTEFKAARKHGKLQPVKITETDDTKMNNMLWDYAIEDWEGFKDKDGDEFVCNLENKIILMKGSPDFFRFVDDCLDRLIEQRDKERKEVEKN